MERSTEFEHQTSDYIFESNRSEWSKIGSGCAMMRLMACIDNLFAVYPGLVMRLVMVIQDWANLERWLVNRLCFDFP